MLAASEEMLRKPASCLMLLPALLWAADFWESKPFTDWSDKEVRRVMTNSPWARQTNTAMSNARPSLPPADSPVSGFPAADGSPIRVPNLGRGGGTDAGTITSPDVSFEQGLSVMIRWQTALPLRQAQMRAKYGKEAATAPGARKILDQDPAMYVISVMGIPGALVTLGGAETAKRSIQDQTTLAAKGKPALHPDAVELVRSGDNSGDYMEVLLAFPKTAPFALADQEIEFASRIGTVEVKYRFRLKDMVVRGKLEL
jgi:hypothetical protein